MYPYPDQFDYGGGGDHHNPGGVLLKRVAGQRARVPILMVDIEVTHRSTPELVRIATTYLQRDSVQSVLGFKIFPDDARGYHEQPPRLRKPALAVVFERVPGQAAAPFAIQVAQEVSFGTQPIARRVRRCLSGLPTRTQAADANNPRVIPPAPYENENIALDPQNVEANFGRMAQHPLVVPVTNYPPGANALPNIVFDLRDIFQDVLTGWENDILGG